MGKNYLQLWRDRRLPQTSAPPTAEGGESSSESGEKGSSHSAAGPVRSAATSETRPGYRDDDGTWHPSPDTKAFLRHFSGCPKCGPEAEALGLKAAE